MFQTQYWLQISSLKSILHSTCSVECKINLLLHHGLTQMYLEDSFQQVILSTFMDFQWGGHCSGGFITTSGFMIYSLCETKFVAFRMDMLTTHDDSIVPK